MRLVLHNLYTQVVEATDTEYARLEDLLRFKHPQAYYMHTHKIYIRSHGQEGWDGYIRFFKRSRFPSGLLPFVLDEAGLKIQVLDQRKKPELAGNGHLHITHALKDHQIQCLQILQHRVHNLWWCRGIFDHCTASGKTLSAALLIKRINQDTLYIVPKRDLLLQTSEVLENAIGEKVGKIGYKWEDLNQKITVATAPMLMSRFLQSQKRKEERLQFLLRQKVLILDECHHIRDNKWYRIAQLIPAYYRFGFSASPFERQSIDCVNLIASTGDVFTVVKSKDLIESGELLSNIEIKMLEIPTVLPQRLGYRSAYHYGIAANEDRNYVIAHIAKAARDAGKIVLILVTELKQGDTIRTMLDSLACPSIFLKGESPVDDRHRVIKDIDKFRLVIASSIWDEGVDAPDINFLILAGGGKSRRKLLQRIGRGLRKKHSGENLLTVVDFIDQGNRYLFDHSQQRLEVYRSEAWDVEILSLNGLVKQLERIKRSRSTIQ